MDIVKRVISRYFACAQRFKRYKKKSHRKKRMIHQFHIYYRICDQGNPKVKPDYITKENCLKNAVREFPLDKVKWTVYADNVCDETFEMICKYIPEEFVIQVSVGHGAGTFRMVYEEAVKNDPDDLIYFLEDDYLHIAGSHDVLIEAAKCNYADYLTLYDHPDKYGDDSPNPFVTREGEKTRVYWCNNHHWKVTNSTTMTFASFVDVLRRDKPIFWRYTDGILPSDFLIFTELYLYGRKLISAIPGQSTHGELAYLGPGVNWKDVV